MTCMSSSFLLSVYIGSYEGAKHVGRLWGFTELVPRCECGFIEVKKLPVSASQHNSNNKWRNENNLGRRVSSDSVRNSKTVLVAAVN